MASVFRDERVRLGFASGPGRCGDCHHRQQRFLGFSVSPVVGHAPAIGQEKINSLGAIHRAAASQPNQEINPVFAGRQPAALRHGRSRILPEIVKGGEVEARFLQHSAGVLDVARSEQARIGNHENARPAQLAHKLPQAVHSSHAEMDPCRGLEVEFVRDAGTHLSVTSRSS